MITLYTFGPAFGLPDMSPFVVKAMVLLKMAGQPYEVNAKGFTKAPKGKLPFIDDAGTLVADSTCIRWHLERQYQVDFDAGLSSEQRGVAWAVEKLLEDNLYWIALHSRWVDEGNFRKGPWHFFQQVMPWPLRAIVPGLVRSKMRKSLQAQGMGRHSDAEREAIAVRGIQAVMAILGDKPYLMGDQPCSADAMVFASLWGALCPHFDGVMRSQAQQYPQAIAYVERMRQRYFPEMAEPSKAAPVARAA